MLFLSADLAGWPMRSAVWFCALCFILARRTYLLSPRICRPEVASSLLWRLDNCDLSGQFSTSWLTCLIVMCLWVKQFDMLNLRDLMPMCQTLSFFLCKTHWAEEYVPCPGILLSTYAQSERNLLIALPHDCEAICSESCQGEKVNL